MLQELAEEPLDGLVGGTFVKEYMRAAVDWQLEQVIKFIAKEDTVYADYIKKAMRPQEDQ